MHRSVHLALLVAGVLSACASMGHALHGLHFPGKLVYLFLMTYRYIFVFEQK